MDRESQTTAIYIKLDFFPEDALFVVDESHIMSH